MNDLISRSAVLAMAYCAIKPTQDCPSIKSVVDVEGIEKLPAIDAEPVVRCKDCRYSEPMPNIGVSKFGDNALNCKNFRGDDGYGYSGVSVIWPDDYCSDGALRDDEMDA